MAHGTTGTPGGDGEGGRAILEGQQLRLAEADATLGEDAEHAIGLEDAADGADGGGQRRLVRVVRDHAADEGHHPVLEAAAEVGLLRAEPGDARLDRHDRHHQHRVEAVVVVGHQLEGRRGPVLEPGCPDVEERAHEGSVQPPHEPLPQRDLDAQLARAGPPHALVGRSAPSPSGGRGRDESRLELAAARIDPGQGDAGEEQEGGRDHHRGPRPEPAARLREKDPAEARR